MKPIKYSTNTRRCIECTKKNSTIDLKATSPFSQSDGVQATSWKLSCYAAKARAKEQVRVEKSQETMMDCFLLEGTLLSSGLYENQLYNGEW